jgi:hypothetical protein
MRMFLPIKGPGGRALTPKETVALVVLGLTLVLCVLTLLAGESAFLGGAARNPVFWLVEGLSRALGGGIVALYGIVLLWSGLLFLKGERVADVAPLPGRAAATVAVTVGISGILGISHLDTAGHLGLLVGGALGNTFGAGGAFPVLLFLLLLGLHLAGQGAWAAIREPAVAPVRESAAVAAPSPFGFVARHAPPARVLEGPPVPDDGDPSADERTFAVTRAMEEIERSQGVTIVDMAPDLEARPSVGEDVEAAPAPPPGTEEGDVRDAIRTVEGLLHGLRPVPAGEAKTEWQHEEDYEEADAPPAAAAEEVEEAREPEEEATGAEEAEGDPFARGGLLRRLEPEAGAPPARDDRDCTNFDWRGRPID